MEMVRGDLVFTRIGWSGEHAGSQECLLVFRRSDTKKRINICGKRYVFNAKKVHELIEVLSPAGAREYKDIKAEIDDDGDIICLHFNAQTVTYHNAEMSLPEKTIRFEKPLISSDPADLVAYTQCIETVLRQKQYITGMIKLTTNQQSGALAETGIIVPLFEYYTREVLESLAVHYRKIFELIMYACWTAFEPRMSLSYETWQIKNVYEHLKRSFPKVAVFMVPIYGNTFQAIPPQKHASFSAAELISAYQLCGDVLHTNIPFRRPFDDGGFISRMLEWNKRLEVLLALHRIQIGPDEFVYCRSKPSVGKATVWLDAERPAKVPHDTL